MLHFIQKPKIQNWRGQGFMYSNTTEKMVSSTQFCLLAVLILTKINLYKIVLRVDIFHHLCCNKLEFQIKNLVQLQ